LQSRAESLLRAATDQPDLAAASFARAVASSRRIATLARYPLADGATAHAHRESRRALGKVLLVD